MTTYTITIDTDALGLGVIDSGKVVVARKRATAADQYPPVDFLYEIATSTSADGIASAGIKADDSSTYHVCMIWDAGGAIVYRETFSMPPTDSDLHELSEAVIGGSNIQFQSEGQNVGTPSSVATIDITGDGVESEFSGGKLTLLITNQASAAAAKINSELISRADSGDGSRRALIEFSEGSSSSDSICTNPTYNLLKPELACAAIMSGGGSVDPHMIGYRYPYHEADGPADAVVLPFAIPDTDPAKAKLLALKRKRSGRIVSCSVANGRILSVVIAGETTTITLENDIDPETEAPEATALLSGESAWVEYQEPSAAVDTGSDTGNVAPSYSSIGPGGYDCQIWGGLMHQVRGAHHRVIGGSHGTLIGGSYNFYRGGEYGVMVGGSQNEVGPNSGYGSGGVGGLRNRAYGYNSGWAGGQECYAGGTYSFTVGGYRVKLYGTASFGGGRNVTAYGHYTFASGYQQTNAYGHDYGFLGPGLGGRTRAPHNFLMYADRNTDSETAPNHIMGQADYIAWKCRSTGTTPVDMTLGEPHYDKDDILDNDVLEIPAGCVWLCTLKTVARNHAPRPAVYIHEFAAYNLGGTAYVEMIGSPRVLVHSGHGTGGNAASVTVSASGSGIKITWQPRMDATAESEVVGMLQILEVAASPG